MSYNTNRKKKGRKKMKKEMFKKTGQELQDYLQFQRRGSVVPNKKGKGAYRRNEKHRNRKDWG